MPSGTQAAQATGHSRYQEVRLHVKQTFGTSLVVAQDKLQRELVTLKMVPRSQVGSDGCAEREVLALMRLTHPHISTLKEVFLTGEHLVLVLEYVVGSSLAELVPPGTGVAEGQARWLFTQVLFALEYCHRMGVATGALRPEGIWVDQSGSRPIIKLADFSRAAPCRVPAAAGSGAPATPFDLRCAAAAGPRAALLQDVAQGAPIFSPPEVIDGSGEWQLFDARAADVWALGVLLHRMLMGTSPFERPADAQLGHNERMKAMVKRVRQARYRLSPKLSRDCRDLLSGLLVADPSLRPSLREVIAHPWCSEATDPAQLLRCNAVLAERSTAHPPPAELVRDVEEILFEATLSVSTPDTDDELAKAHTFGSLPSEALSEGLERVGSTESGPENPPDMRDL